MGASRALPARLAISREMRRREEKRNCGFVAYFRLGILHKKPHLAFVLKLDFTLPFVRPMCNALLRQTSKSYITGVETSEITGLTVCGSVISNPVFLCIFTLHADNNWLENEMNRYQSTL